MTLHESLYAFLTGDPGVGGLVGDRVYTSVAPAESELPQIVMELDNQPSRNDAGGDSGLTPATWIFNCYGEISADASAVADAVEAILNGGSWPGDMVGTWIQGAFRQDRTDEVIESITDEEPSRFLESLEVTIWYTKG